MATKPMRDQFLVDLLLKLPAKRHVGPRPSDEFIENHQAQFAVNDWNSCEAAIVTFQKHGSELKEYTIGPHPFVYAWFNDGSNAVAFYNRLPKNMERWYVRNPVN